MTDAVKNTISKINDAFIEFNGKDSQYTEEDTMLIDKKNEKIIFSISSKSNKFKIK